jgi:dipeptidyl-peptidase-4
MHLYLYSMKKGFLNAITSGEWEVTDIVEITADKVYYTSTESSPLARDLYSVSLNGKNRKRMTGGDGTYRISAGRGMHYYISSFTNVSTPLTITLCDGRGKQLRLLEDNSALKSKIAYMGVPEREFFTFRTDAGTELNGYVIKPVGFDSTKRYPVLMTQYSGPGSQSVADVWSIGWEDVLAQKGYVVACVDGRGTGYRGEEFKKCTYRNLGALETEDQISAARHLASLAWVDASRIGIYGWSYGGFMALNSILKGNDVFKLAVAVAPVTSWRYYDTVYTEVYNGLPQDNAAGYDNNSPINYAERLSGKLLLIHGSGDDNVHVQNSYEMAKALVAKGKQFDMMIYPDDNHSMYPNGSVNIRQKMIEYITTNL